MNSDTKESLETLNKNTELERAQFLWDEYKYRHEHCWKLIFQITTAVVILLVIPYIKTDIARTLGNWVVSLPALGIALSLFAILRLRRELDVFDKIKVKYRELQSGLYGTPHESEASTFSHHVILYISSLVLLGIADIFVISYIWIPSLS